MHAEFDMTRPEEMCRLASRAMRETGRAHADARRAADDAERDAKLEAKAASIAARRKDIDIGENPTADAVKDFAATCAPVVAAETASAKAAHRERLAEVDWKCACADVELLKGLLFHSGRRDGK